MRRAGTSRTPRKTCQRAQQLVRIGYNVRYPYKTVLLGGAFILRLLELAGRNFQVSAESNSVDMRIWPEGAWFGLTRRVVRAMLWSLAYFTTTLLLTYGALRSYVLYEAHRSAQLLEALSSVQIGDSEQSVLTLARRFPASKNTDLDHLAGTYGYTLGIAPWWPVRDLTHFFDRATAAFVLHFPPGIRKRAGLRDFYTVGRIHVRDARVLGVEVTVAVDGRDELLEAQWDLRNQIPDYYLDESRFQTSQSHFRLSHLHYGYQVGKGVTGLITPQTSAADKVAAHNINLKCLTSFTGCASLAELAPDAARRLAH